MSYSLDNSILHIRGACDYTCSINAVTNKQFTSKKVYLLCNLITNDKYWAYYNAYVQLFELYEYIELNCNVNAYGNRNNIHTFILQHNLKNYSIHEPAVQLFMVPVCYTIINDRKKWDEYCAELNASAGNIEYVTHKISHLVELTSHIGSFL